MRMSMKHLGKERSLKSIKIIHVKWSFFIMLSSFNVEVDSSKRIFRCCTEDVVDATTISQ